MCVPTEKNQLNESYKIMLWKNSTITGTQNNSLSTSRTPLPFPILVSNWRKLSVADVYWFYPVLDWCLPTFLCKYSLPNVNCLHPVLDWCKLVPRREVPEDDLTSLMSVNVGKAQHQNLTLATRLPYVESHPDALKFHPRAQKISNSLPEPKKISNSLPRPNISPEQHHRVGPAIFLQPSDKPTGPGRHLHHCYHDQIIIVYSCLICIVRSQLEIIIWAFIKSH